MIYSEKGAAQQDMLAIEVADPLESIIDGERKYPSAIENLRDNARSGIARQTSRLFTQNVRASVSSLAKGGAESFDLD